MVKQGMTRAGAMTACLLAATLSASAQAAEPSHGMRVTEALGFDQTFQEGITICHEKMAEFDLDSAIKNNPQLLGGIQRGEPEFAEAEAAYHAMTTSYCDYDLAVGKTAFARALDDHLTPTEAEALVAFYATELGQRFRTASLAANVAANRVTEPRLDSEKSNAIFGEKIAALIARRALPASQERVIGATQALPSADAAVALSDRVMQYVVAGKAVEGFDLVRPHALVTKAQMDAFLQQVTTQQTTWDARFGKSTGYELVRNDTAGDSMVRTLFLHRFDEHAIAWYFIWYRGTKGWVLDRFVFLEDSTKLFQ
jgi:hypothetical protein